MTSFRFSAVSGVAALVLGSLAPLAATAQQGYFFDSVAGSYLAGIEALNDLDADAAADRLARAAMADPGHPLVLSRAFLAQLVAGRVRESTEMARDVLAIEPNDELAMITLATVALDEHRYAAAIELLDGTSESSVLGIAGRVMQAWAQLGAGDADAANATLDRLGAGGFGEFLTLYRALLADVAGDRDAALDFASQAYARDPYLVRTVEAYARMLANSGDFETAGEVVDAYNAEAVSNPLIDAVAQAVDAGERPGLFVETVEQGSAELLYGLGVALVGEGSTELGIVLLRLALFLEPDSAVSAIALGEVLADAGRLDASSQVVDAVAEDSALHTSAQTLLANNLDQSGNTEEAVARLEVLAERYPDNIQVLGALGDILRIDQQWEAASDVYSQLLAGVDAENPRNWRYFYVRGITLERAGRWEEAEADFQSALALNPNHPSVLNYLGYTWIDMGINLDQGLDMIERAISADPGNGYIVDSLGWAFYRLGRYDEAVVELERAVNMLPDDPEVNDHLGDAYWRAGRQLEATFQWRIAASVDEEGDVTARALEKLASGLADDDDGSRAPADAEAAAR